MPSSLRFHSALIFWGASAMFFLSGGTGLAYQVIWFKKFSQVWGSSSLAMAAVVASFLTGLGLGAHLIGRITDRIRGPLFWYGAAEAVIGVIALFIPFELQVLQGIAAGLYSTLEPYPAIHTVVRFLLTFLVLGPPCILMGGTLPLLCKHFIRPGAAPRESTGWLYAINTLGAATGCYLSGFHLLPGIGLFTTNLLVAALNLAIGATAMGLYRSGVRAAAEAAALGSPADLAELDPDMAPPVEAPVLAGEAVEPGGPSLVLLYIAVAITGCAALILEMVWSRQLSLILGGSTYAFSAMLTQLLVGIGLGSLAFHIWFRKAPSRSYVPALVIMGLGVTALLGKIFVPELSIVVSLLKDLRGTQRWNAVICMGASLFLELLPAIGMGLLFPLFIDLTRKRAAEAGRAIGTIYAWNTVGSIIGATITSLLFVPILGGTGTIALALGLYTVALLLMLPFPRSPREAIVAIVVVEIMAGATYLSAGKADPRITDIGLYMYGWSGHETHKYQVEMFAEGHSANVLVTSQQGHYSLRVNGKVDASTGGDMNNQLGHAYLPRFMFPGAKNVIVIGFGSGTTSGTSLLFPGTRVTCCEIEPNVYKASKFFASVNHSPEAPKNRDRFRVVFDDGRSYLHGSDQQYDLVLSAPSNPWIAGIASLFTQEFYGIVKDKLTPNGILAQWIQMYSFQPIDYAMVVKTIMQVFPHCGLIRISNGDTLLFASKAPLTRTSADMDQSQALIDALPEVQKDLAKYFGTTDVRTLLLTHLLLDTPALQSLWQSQEPVPVNRDYNLKLEFEAPRRLFAGDRRAQVMARMLQSARKEWFQQLSQDWGCGKAQAEAFHTLSGLFDRTQQPELVTELVDLGLKLDPDHAVLLTDKLILDKTIDRNTFSKLVSHLHDLSRKEMNRLGVELFQQERFEHSVMVFTKLLESHPNSVTTWNNLAVAYEAWGKLEEAEKSFLNALQVDPLSDFAKKSYLAFQEKHGKKPPAGATGTPSSQAAPPSQADSPSQANSPSQAATQTGSHEPAAPRPPPSVDTVPRPGEVPLLPPAEPAQPPAPAPIVPAEVPQR